MAGKTEEINYDAGAARVARIGGDNSAELSGLTELTPGQSGSPIVLMRGIIGMLVKDAISSKDGMIPIEQIHVEATRENLPWMLADSNLPPPIPTHVCLVVSGATQVKVGLNGVAGFVSTDSKGCLVTNAGRYRIAILDAAKVVCTPPELMLSREPNQTIHLVCSVDPQGIWQAQRAGYLTVVPNGEGQWSVQGMQLLSAHGEFQGTLRGIPPNLSLDVQASDGAVLQGPFSLEPKSLKGRVFLDGSPVEIDFER